MRWVRIAQALKCENGTQKKTNTHKHTQGEDILVIYTDTQHIAELSWKLTIWLNC